MVSAAIVLFNENLETLKRTVHSFLNTATEKHLYLIDNSPNNTLQKHFIHPEITYIFVGKNIGFGNAHNLILNKLTSNFHLILNPDVVFKPTLIPDLIQQLNKNKATAFITPKVLYPNETLQYVCRKNPTFFDLINRKLKLSKKNIYINEYRNLDVEKPFNPEFIHGCFMLFKTDDFKALKGFDDRYFLYMEDADICREVYKTGKNILYFPDITIEHQHKRDSSKSVKLFFIHTISAIKYFIKWGF